MEWDHSNNMFSSVPDLALGQVEIDGTSCKYCYIVTLETEGFQEGDFILP